MSIPPLRPNAYSDGSLKHPRISLWSLGGLGVWWPERDVQQHPITDAEHAIANHSCTAAGTSLWGAITGQRASSTRTELAAGIAALLSSQAVHQATGDGLHILQAQSG